MCLVGRYTLLNQSINHCSDTTTVSLTKGFTSHSTQNRSHRRRSSEPISWLTQKKLSTTQQKQPGIEQVQPLADISHSRHIATAMKPMHQLQIHPTVHDEGAPPTIPPHYIVVRAVVWECGEGQTDRHTDAHDQYTFCVMYDSHKTETFIRNTEILQHKINTKKQKPGLVASYDLQSGNGEHLILQLPGPTWGDDR